MHDVAHVLGRLRRLAQSVVPDVSEVDLALPALLALLNESQAPYRIVGGIAVIHHGYQRFTEDIDVLVSGEALAALKERAQGHDFAMVSSRRLRHTPTGVRVDLLVEGQPIPRGDGLTYPSPENAGASPRDATFVGLRGLLELKLLSHRAQDLSDVTQLLKKVDDSHYLVLESEVSRELRGELARLRDDALEELSWAAAAAEDKDDNERDDDERYGDGS